VTKETQPGRLSPGAAAVLLFLWVAFLVRGFWYCALLPPWEGYDEPFHFAALQHVAGGQGLPQAGSLISLEVQNSLHLLPLPWELQFHQIPQPLTAHDAFWKLSPAERSRRMDAVRALPPEQGSQPATELIENYESQQAPLYYWLFAIPLRWTGSLPLLSRLYLLRVLNVLLASLAVPLVYWTAKRVLENERKALATTAIIILLPELMINLARVGNESLALICYTAMLSAAVLVVGKPLRWRGWLLLGAALGLGLLAKAFFLSAAPAFLAVAAISLWSPDRSSEKPAAISIAARSLSALVITILIAGRWYAQVHSTTGSWSGLSFDAALRHTSLIDKLAAVPHVNWKSGILSVLVSHAWFGGWSFLRVPNAVYVMVFAVIAMAIVGAAVRLLRRHGLQNNLSPILVLTAFYACFWAGLGYHVLITYLSQGVSSSNGWYLYAAVVAEVILLIWGLEAWWPAGIVLLGLALGAAALDLYGIHALLMPYYTGLTAHAGKSVPAALWPTLTHLPLVFSRLSELRPAWLGARVLLSSWLGYWLATVGSVLVAAAPFRERPSDS
jgi:4-amino-4-deoxy-L-arabinose transferase-like glycosyltransferase